MAADMGQPPSLERRVFACESGRRSRGYCQVYNSMQKSYAISIKYTFSLLQICRAVIDAHACL